MTRRVALIGKPLRRPHSQVMHNAAFSHYGVDADYELRDMDPSEVAPFVQESRDADWLGFQVTAPYKEVVVTHLDDVEADAREIGAVNSVVREAGGSLVGFNTDAPGFLTAVGGAGVEMAGVPAFVAGAGGAARAVAWSLLRAGASHVHIANRTLPRAVSLAESLKYLGPVTALALDDDRIPAVLAGSLIAVNATTVGMTTAGVAFDVSDLPSGAAVFDLVYVPSKTPLVEAAKRRGLVVRNGLDMLVEQAQIAFERWTGIAGAGDVMRAAVEAMDGTDDETA